MKIYATERFRSLVNIKRKQFFILVGFYSRTTHGFRITRPHVFDSISVYVKGNAPVRVPIFRSFAGAQYTVIVHLRAIKRGRYTSQ